MDFLKDNKKYVYLYPPFSAPRLNEYQQTNGNLTIKVKVEPNELFVKCTYSGFGPFVGIGYYLNGNIKTFEDFRKKLNGRVIDEIVLYFLRYNYNALFMTIFLKTNEYDEEPAINYCLNYRLGLKGEWEEASQHFYIFGELKYQAQRLNMLQYFEIEMTEEDCQRSRLGDIHPHIDVFEMLYGDFKAYRHNLEMGIRVTKFFTYKGKILKDIIMTEKDFSEIYVYYVKNDTRNNMPLLIVIIIGSDRIYYVNKGGNYKWEEVTLPYIENSDKLTSLLENTKKKLIGEVIELKLDVPDYYKKPGIVEGSVFCEMNDKPNCMNYTEYKFYRTDNGRFSISRFPTVYNYVSDFPLPLYSILGLSVFCHENEFMPVFICAVYDNTEEDMVEWYQLKISNTASYEFSHLLTEHPNNFPNMWAIVKYCESNLYSINFEIGSNLAQTKQKEVLCIDGVYFKTSYKNLGTHKKHLFEPEYEILFSVKQIIIYEEKIRNLYINYVMKIFVFERSLYHLLICIVKADMDYEKSKITESYIWFECFRPSHIPNGWKCIGPMNTKNDPNKVTDKQLEQITDENKKWLDEREFSNQYYSPYHIDIPITPSPYDYYSYPTPPPLNPEEYGHLRARRDINNYIYPTTTTPHPTSTTYSYTTTTGGNEQYPSFIPFTSVPTAEMSKLKDPAGDSSFAERGVLMALFCITLMSTLAVLVVYRENFSLNKKIKPLLETVKKFANPNR